MIVCMINRELSRYYVTMCGDGDFTDLVVWQEILEWYEKNVEKPLQAKGIIACLHVNRLNNWHKQPGFSFNYNLRVAYEDGADWLYRINDDSIFKTPFAKSLTTAVKGFGYPYGVAGPYCPDGNTKILTHGHSISYALLLCMSLKRLTCACLNADFVHRTHMDIFDGVYYPPEFGAWWM
jgi:hypothetical protein